MKRCIFFFYSILLISCCSLEISDIHQEIVDELSVYHVGNDKYYVNSSSDSNELVIYLEGSCLNSVLGIKVNNKWTSYTFSHYILDFFKEESIILIPEKPLMDAGGDYYDDDEVLSSYNVSNLMMSYANSIDDYLSRNKFKKVSLIGASEGGLLAPLVYNNLKYKSDIDNIIIIGSGGMSQYECFKVLAESPIDMPDSYRQQLQYIEVAYNDVMDYPSSISKFYLGWPYSRWSSFFDYKPIEDIEKIEVPILFFQGVLDFSSPVESVEYLQQNLPNTNISYIYKDQMGHFPEDDNGVRDLLSEIRNWIIAN